MLKKIFRGWTVFELCLLGFSLLAITISFFLGEDRNPLSLFTSLFGVISVLFVAKGLIAGQYLTLIFTVLYALLSFSAAYYGEVIIAAATMLPATVISLVTWTKNPAENRAKVKVNKLPKKEWIVLTVAVPVITTVAYFVLRALNTAELIVSTVSFITSLSAAYLLIRRSAYYAIFYILNDVVLIVLWSLALAAGQNVLPSIICYCVFLLNDTYAFIDWRRRARLQEQEKNGVGMPASNSEKE